MTERYARSIAPEATAALTTLRSGMRTAGGARAAREFPGTARFRPLSVIGRGGMGIVYRVVDQEVGREVALKTLPALSPAEIVDLKEEFRAVADLAHPNLIEVYELVVEGGEAFFTMELLDGQDLARHLRGGSRGAGSTPGFVERLLDTLPQLASAVGALHRAGLIHRDIKPSNVWVTSAGRVVLLDFGLARAQAEGGSDQAGTLQYMAPEQLWGGPLSPSADWYAVGGLLFEAATGRPAFEGTPKAIVSAKADGRLTRPKALVPETPDDLDDLVVGLLRAEARRRAGEAEVVRWLRARGRPCELDPTPAAPFLGREAEIAALRAALDRAAAGGPVLYRLHGPSGIGKTELLRSFTAGAEVDPGALVLRGRCHPQEQVPFKALDGVVDALSRWLASLPAEEVRALAPAEARTLQRVFPALAAISALERSEEGHAVEPQEQRRRAFAALRELLAALSRARPVVIAIDDLQWGDTDSALLLRELLLGGPCRLLVVVAHRAEEHESAVLREVGRVAAALPVGASWSASVAPLDEDHARALAASLLRRDDGTGEEIVAGIAREAAGSPFFLTELARSRARGECDDLRRVLCDRLDRLRPAERAVLEVVCTAGGPVERSVALAAAGLGEAGRPDVTRLARACLLRFSEGHEHARVEAYHDRIRELLLDGLGAVRRVECHRALADALSATTKPDPEALLRHHLGAEDRRAAATVVVPAAERAGAALAFDRAAELYALALDLGADDLPRWALLERRADALANAGRGFEAAASFAEAAERAAPADRAPTLRRRAAEHYLRSGRLAEGVSLVRGVLEGVGVRLPGSRRRAMAEMAVERLRLLGRGLTYRRRAPSEVPERVRARLDALWSASTSLSMIDHVVADALGVRYLREALDAGEPSRITRGLGYEAAFEALIGGPLFARRSRDLLDRMDDAARGSPDPYDRAWSVMSRGITAWLHADWATAAALCDEAAATYRSHCRGIAWELAITDSYTLPALAYLGRLDELARRAPAAARDAESRGDVFAANMCRLGLANMVHLLDDRPEAALAEARAALAPFDGDTYLLPHYHHAIAVVQAELYRASPEAALAHIEAAWRGLGEAQFLRAQCVRAELHHLRGRAALAAASRRADPAAALRLVEASARALDDDTLPLAPPFAAALRAGAAAVTGHAGRAAALLSDARAGFARAGMAIYEAAARARLAELRGDAAGAGEARAFFAAQGARDPEGIIAMLLPGVGVSRRPCR